MDVSFLAVVGLLRGRLLALFVLVASLALAVARILAAVVVLVVAAGSGKKAVAGRGVWVCGASLGAEVQGRGGLAVGYSAHKKAQSGPGFGLLRASALTSNREEKQLVL